MTGKVGTLLDLTDEVAALARIIDDLDAQDLTPEQRDLALYDMEEDLWAREGAVGAKIDGYLAVADAMQARATARAAEAKRLQELARIEANAAERVLAHLKHRLEQAYNMAPGTPPIQTPLHKVNIANVGGVRSLEIKEPDTLRAVMPGVFAEETVYTPKKDVIRAALEAWEALEATNAAARAAALEVDPDGDVDEALLPTPHPFNGLAVLKPRATKLVAK